MSLVSSHSTVPGASGPTDASRLQDALRATAGLREADVWASVRRILESGGAALAAESAGVWLRAEGERGARLRAGWPAGHEARADGAAAPGALEAPLDLAGGETGVLRFERAAAGAPWSEAERLFAVALAERITAVLERGARLEAERELRERERQVEEAEALAGLGSWEWDVPTNVIRWSNEQLRVHGLDASMHPDTFEQFLAHVHPDDRALVVEECERLMATGEPFGFTYRIVRTDGRTRWLHARGRMTAGSDGAMSRMVGTSHDTTERREAEEALRKSEARFRAVFEQFPLSIQIFDPSGRTVEANQRWEELFDATVEEVREFNPLTEPQLAEVGAFIRRGFLGETIDVPASLFEARTAGPDGKGAGKREPRWIEAFICPVRYDAGDVKEVMIVHRDVTDEKRSEVALRASEESYRTIFELAGDAIFVHDPETGAVLDANRKACELHGVTLDELRAIGVAGVSAGDPAATGAESRELVRRAAAGEPQLFEWQGRYNPTQEPVWVEVSLQRVGILGETRVLAIVRNVTERKLAEQALQQAYEELERRVAERTEELAVANRALESEIAEHRTAREQLQQQTAELEALFQALPDVYLRLREDGVVVDHRFGSDEALYPIPDGFPPILAGARITEYMPAELGGLLLAGIAGVRRSGQTATFEYPLPVGGEERYFETRVAPMPDDTVICVIRDITARKLSQAALAQAKEEADRAREAAEHANRAKSEFLSRMSHELRTPMNSILGFAQLLARVELPPQHSRSVQHILKAGRHLLQLINEVLEIARIEAGRQNFSLEPVRIGTVLHEAMGLVRPLAAQLHVQVEEGRDTVVDAYVRADRQRLAQVLLNLLSNAIKYNRPGGRVRLTCSLEAEEFDALAAGAGAVGAEAVRLAVRVEDTGHGIPADRVEQLFTPFSRLGAEQSDVEGTGLGLALSQRLTEAMGGTLELERTGAEGSVFRLALDVADSPLGRIEEPGAPAGGSAEAAHRPATLLYVEDNLANLSLVETILLSRPKWRTIPALQGKLGVELAREHTPDLILLDLHLPDIPGEEVLRRLRAEERTAAVPIVVISADATASTLERLRAAGVAGFLTKPLDVDEFLSTLDRLLPGTGEAG